MVGSGDRFSEVVLKRVAFVDDMDFVDGMDGDGAFPFSFSSECEPIGGGVLQDSVSLMRASVAQKRSEALGTRAYARRQRLRV